MAKAMSKEMVTPPSISSLAEAAERARARGTPPVHLWTPDFTGDIDMRIARDGSWFYQGTPIGRPEMVALFASILRREGDRHFLVTPVEKVGIKVEDAPFLAVDVEASGEGREQELTFTTNLGERTTAGPDHPIRVEIDPKSDEPAPYVTVRDGLEARIDRKSFYRLVEWGEERDGWFGLWSGGAFFPITASEDMA